MTAADTYFVLSPDDVITHVSEPLHGQMGRYIGHSVWVQMPRSELVFRPHFQEARRNGREVECVAYYAGGIVQMRIVPSGESLTVYPTRLAELNVRTLATLRESLRAIVDELAGRASAQPGPRAHGSLQALP